MIIEQLKVNIELANEWELFQQEEQVAVTDSECDIESGLLFPFIEVYFIDYTDVLNDSYKLVSRYLLHIHQQFQGVVVCTCQLLQLVGIYL